MQKVTWILAYFTVALATICYADTLTATCTMSGTSAVSSEKITGTVKFTQSDSTDVVNINIDLKGFDTSNSNTEHGFHIHKTGSTGNNCADASSHFDGVTAGSHNHGAQTASNRHVGDLGNIVEQSGGVVVTSKSDTQISLKSSSNGYIIGRAVVVHQDRDDLGLGGQSDSLTTGHAGARIGCCVIKAGAQGVSVSLTIMTICLAILTVMKW